MKCSKIQYKAIDYVEGILSAHEKHALESHLAGCNKCAAFVADIRMHIGALKTMEPVNAPDHLWHGIARKIDEMEQPSPFVIWLEDIIGSLRRHAVPAVSFAVIIIASAVLLSKGDLFKKSNLTFVDVSDDVTTEISVYIREHKLPDNSPIYQGEMADVNKALEEGV